MESVYLNGGFIGKTFDFADTERYTSGTALSATYVTLVQNNTPGPTSHTFSGVSTTGLTSSDTLIVIFHSEVTGHSAGNPVTSIAINGTSATIDAQTPTTTVTGNIGITAIARISGITASSVSIAVTYPNQNILRAAVSTYIVAGVTSLTVLDTDEFAFVGSSSSQTLTTTVENGGLVIYGLSIGDENDTTVWSDATENYDTAASENNSQWAGAYYLPTANESHVETLTISGATDNGVGLAVSYETKLVIGNLKNSGIWLLQSVYDSLYVNWNETAELGAASQTITTIPTTGLTTTNDGLSDWTYAVDITSFSSSDNGVLFEVGGGAVGTSVQMNGGSLIIQTTGGTDTSASMSAYTGQTGTLYVTVDYGNVLKVYWWNGSSMNFILEITSFASDYVGTDTTGIGIVSNQLRGTNYGAYAGTITEWRSWPDLYYDFSTV